MFAYEFQEKHFEVVFFFFLILSDGCQKYCFKSITLFVDASDLKYRDTKIIIFFHVLLQKVTQTVFSLLNAQPCFFFNPMIQCCSFIFFLHDWIFSLISAVTAAFIFTCFFFFFFFQLLLSLSFYFCWAK